MIVTVAHTVRALLRDLFADAGDSIPLLYGGSVAPDNCGDYARRSEIDGLFVGRADWTVSGFVDVLRNALATKEG